ncbi:hypothetical protein [uncultured Prevotella sp.]|uniref:hypothetical protein n=1 Tax=uncultured Prevotella sp. TaxID=159272 RepID=UPI0025E0AB5A|nr:hypothetical protein [uncultured Prevotella sp.]
MNKSVPIWMLSILAMVFGFASCDRYGNSKTFFVADSLSQSNPTAAMAFIDSVTGKVSGLSDGDRMRLSLLRAKAQNLAGIVFTSDTAMREVVKYYEQHGTGDDRMLAYYIMGSVYRDLDDSPMALQYFQKASEQADTASSDCNYHLLSRIHGQAACLFLAQETPYYALKEFVKAERYSLMSGDTLSALIFYEQRANAYYLLNQMDSVIAVRKRVCDEYLKHGFFEQASLAVGALVHQMLRTGNYVEARKYMNIYDRYAFSKGEIEKLIRDKSETVEVLQGKIDEYAKKQKDIYTKKKNVEISNSLIVMKFHYFAEKVMTTPSFEDWKELYLFVSNELPELAEFKDVLKHGEYEVCVLVKLGFAPSEISTLTGRKLSDIANVRKRLLVKLANREGSAKDFDNYIKTEF